MTISLLMITLSVSILFLVTPWMKLMTWIWLKMSAYLFRYTVIHGDDRVNDDFYALTFTNDERWQEKMLRDLKNEALEMGKPENKK